MGSVVLPHLNTAWHVDQAILSEDERLVVIRFGRDGDPDCMKMDEVLFKIADKVKNFAAVYVCDIDQVPDFNQMYELYDPMTVMFFFRNKHIMCDFGTGNNNKLTLVVRFYLCPVVALGLCVPATNSARANGNTHNSSRRNRSLSTSSRLSIVAQRRGEVWSSVPRVSTAEKHIYVIGRFPPHTHTHPAWLLM